MFSHLKANLPRIRIKLDYGEPEEPEKRKFKSEPSILLTEPENDLLLSLLGAKCHSLATGIIQLFLADDHARSQWRRHDAGVLCFIKDHGKRSYFFRIYCLNRRNMVWEQRIYKNLEYLTPEPWFHTFEAEASMAAFNFSSDDEAQVFRKTVLEHIENKEIRRRIRKEDIAAPQDFRHVSHIGKDVWKIPEESEGRPSRASSASPVLRRSLRQEALPRKSRPLSTPSAPMPAPPPPPPPPQENAIASEDDNESSFAPGSSQAEPVKKVEEPPAGGSNTPTNFGFLNEIAKGVNLKPVTVNKLPKMDSGPKDPVLKGLRDAIDARRFYMSSSESDSDFDD